jgi:hypothetical protein
MPHIDSQWAAQFAIAAELVRRGYAVAFVLGNQPPHDALVRGTELGNRVPFQVKGFKNKGSDILVGRLALNASNARDLFGIVYVSNPPNCFEFFIATREELDSIKNPANPILISHQTGFAIVLWRLFETVGPSFLLPEFSLRACDATRGILGHRAHRHPASMWPRSFERGIRQCSRSASHDRQLPAQDQRVTGKFPPMAQGRRVLLQTRSNKPLRSRKRSKTWS